MKEIMSLKNVIIYLMLLFYFIFGVSFLLVGPNDLFNWKTCVLSLSVVLFLGLIVKFSDSNLFVQNVIMTIFFSLFIIPRLIIYLLMPSMVIFSFGITITNDQINIALLYLLFGTIFIYAGFLVAERIFRRFMVSGKPDSDPAKYHAGVVLAVFLITIIVGLYIRDILGVNSLNIKQTGVHDWLIQSLLLVFNIDFVFFMACASLLFKKVFDKKAFFAIFFIVTAYLTVLSFTGSRGGGMRVDLMIFMILLCIKGNFKVRFRYAGIFFIILFLTYVTWPFSMQKRIDTVAQGYANAAKKEMNAVEQNYANAVEKKINMFRKAHSDGILLYKDCKKHFTAVMNRMGLIDNEIVILSIDAEPQAKSKYMNMSYAGKNIVNLLLPGVVFKDAEINTSRVIPVLYRSFSDDYLKVGGYSSDFYTPWGVFFLIFGWWKGWFMLLVAAMGVHLVYLFTMHFRGKYRYYMGALCLFSVSHLFYANMGIDHWIATSGLIIISGVSAIVLFELGEFILNRIRLLMR